jgi:hypothetical protein
MKLLGSDGSPYARKARIAIAEKGVACEFVSASPRDPASGVSAANPLSKIPTLLLDDAMARSSPRDRLLRRPVSLPRRSRCAEQSAPRPLSDQVKIP